MNGVLQQYLFLVIFDMKNQTARDLFTYYNEQYAPIVQFTLIAL